MSRRNSIFRSEFVDEKILGIKICLCAGSLLSIAGWTQSNDRSSLHGPAQTAAAYLGDSRESKK